MYTLWEVGKIVAALWLNPGSALLHWLQEGHPRFERQDQGLCSLILSVH